MNRKKYSILIMSILIIIFMQIYTTPVFAVSQTDAIIAFAKSKIGSSEYNGLCLKFCRDAYEAAGIYSSARPNTAYEAGTLWIQSTSSSNIPIGALVFFDYTWHATAGHVGIYIGNGKMIDAESAYGGVQIRNFSTRGYRGWGYYGGIKPNDNTSGPPEAPANVRTQNGKRLFSDKEYITFYWDTSVSATDYWIYMWKDGKQIYATDMGNNTSFTSAPTSAGKYTLIVRAGNNFGYSNGPASVDFIVYDKLPSTPSNLMSIDKKTVYSSSEYISFSWDSVSTATNYIVSLWQNGVFLYETDMQASTGFTSAPIVPGKYTFTVKAKNDYGLSNEAVFNFVVGWYTVKYDLNGGTGVLQEQKKVYGEPLVLNGISPFKENYVFCGWAQSPNGPVEYQPGSVYSKNDNITLYAVWKESALLGDVNGDGTIDAADAVMIQRYDSGLTTLTDEQLTAADVNADGLVDAADAVKIQRYDAGLIAAL